MRRAALVIAGSSYLARRAAKVSSNIEVVPTVVSAATLALFPDTRARELEAISPELEGRIT